MEEVLDARLFRVSTTNVNFGVPFGESEADRKLVANMKASMTIESPFLARPEPPGYGVYAGKRRFESALIAGFTKFRIGKDCIINDVTDEEAEEASWAENYYNQEFRVDMDCVSRAKGLQKIIGRSSLHDYSKRSGIPVSTLSEYLSVLKTSPKIQKELTKGTLTYSNGVELSRLPPDTQEDLGKVLEKEGNAPFKKQLAKHREKRGIPADVYVTDRILWNKTISDDLDDSKIIDHATEIKGFKKRCEYLKDFIKKHRSEIRLDALMRSTSEQVANLKGNEK